MTTEQERIRELEQQLAQKQAIIEEFVAFYDHYLDCPNCSLFLSLCRDAGEKWESMFGAAVATPPMKPTIDTSLLTPVEPPKNIKGPFKNKPPKGFT